MKVALTKEQEELKPILDVIKKESFVSDYKASDEEAIGLLISKFFEYDINAMSRALLYALEDSNAPTEVARISEILKVRI